MSTKVLTYREAVKMGYELTQYRFKGEHLPVGEIIGRLDCKVWAKKVLAVNCYFTQVGTNCKLLLTVYCSPSGSYHLSGGKLDFTRCQVGVCYYLSVQKKPDHSIRLIQAGIYQHKD